VTGSDGLNLSPNAAFSTFSAVATTPASLITALVPSVILISGSGAFDMAATAFAVRSTPASILARTSGLKLRMVPTSATSSGMMFAVVPPWIAPMLTTIKSMRRVGYRPETAAAITAAAATIGPIIPPSLPMVIYGVAADVSIGRLFLGGLVPGILMGISLMAMVAVIAKSEGFSR
jgi:hypothetical protein